MTRAPPRRLRIAPRRGDVRCDFIETLSFLFVRHPCSLGLPKGERHQTPVVWLWRKYSIKSPEVEMSCVPFLRRETQHEEGDAIPKKGERQVVKQGRVSEYSRQRASL